MYLNVANKHIRFLWGNHLENEYWKDPDEDSIKMDLK
jgi:hypothetical protein